ncbi:hypothetical protein ACFYUY_07615 [Kitasatospora sp. NPDC004745]|uniref:hypothetical protein n=1 Tax=unclassified Kitasatospora TaxID=2633591 RepID=UPI0036BC840A
MARLNQAPTARPPDPAPATVQDLIWAHARPSEGLEHVRAVTTDRSLDLYLFVRAASTAAAMTQMHALLTRVHGPLASHGLTLDRR